MLVIIGALWNAPGTSYAKHLSPSQQLLILEIWEKGGSGVGFWWLHGVPQSCPKSPTTKTDPKSRAPRTKNQRMTSIKLGTKETFPQVYLKLFKVYSLRISYRYTMYLDHNCPLTPLEYPHHVLPSNFMPPATIPSTKTLLPKCACV